MGPAKAVFAAGVAWDEIPIVTARGIVHLPADGHVFLEVTHDRTVSATGDHLTELVFDLPTHIGL